MATPPRSTGRVVPIPRSIPSPTDLDGIVQRYKDLRLLGLKVDPEAFTSVYEEEAKFPYETWRSRVMSSIGRTFVAVNSETQQSTAAEDKSVGELESDDVAVQQLLRKEWLGVVTIIGPVPFLEQSDGMASNESAQPRLHTAFIKDGRYQMPSPSTGANEDFRGSHAVFLIVGMFVLPKARRKGLAGHLVEATINYVRDEGRRIGASKTSISIQVASTNLIARGLYERLGFYVSEDAIVMASQRGGEEVVVGMELEVSLESRS